jgi:hypothetical protein
VSVLANSVARRFAHLSLAAAGLCLGLTGCSVDGIGTVAAEVIPGDGAVTVELHSLGGLLNSAAAGPEAALTLGLRRTTLVYTAEAAKDLSPGWHWFVVPLPAAAPQLVRRRSWGLDLFAGDGTAAATLGYRDRFTALRLPSDASLVRRVRFDAADPTRNLLVLCQEMQSCPALFAPAS